MKLNQLVFAGCLITSSVYAHPILKYYYILEGSYTSQKAANLGIKKSKGLYHVKGNVRKTRVKGKTVYQTWIGPFSTLPHFKILRKKPRKVVYAKSTGPNSHKLTSPIQSPRSHLTYKRTIKNKALVSPSIWIEKDKDAPFGGVWRPMVAVGGGAAALSAQAQSQTFSILNPLTDQFYIYTGKHSNQMAGMLDVLVGAEWRNAYPWSIQLGLNYNQKWNSPVSGTFVQGADTLSADLFAYRYAVLTRQLLTEAKFLYHYSPLILPYAMVGLGGASNRASAYSTNVDPFLTFTREYQNNTRTSFSYALGLGIDANVTEHFRVGLGYRFADYGKAQLGEARIDTTPVWGTLSQSHVNTHGILAQVTWLK